MSEPPDESPPEPILSSRQVALALAVVSVAVFIAALDQTMVVTVLPSILRDLRIPITRLNDAAWVVTGYLLGYTVAMPLFGRIADVRGRRLMFMGSIGIFMLGSIFCVFAGDLVQLVGARIVQAMGGGAVVPIAMAVAGDHFPARRRAFALGIIGAAGEAGGVLGPLYGASLAEVFGWRSIFIVNIPIGVALAAACYFLIPAQRPAGGDGLGSRRVDYVGALLLAVALSTLTIGLAGNTQTGQAAIRLPWVIGSLAAFAAFGVYELRQRYPLVRLSLFRRVPFLAANLANLVVGAALIVGMVEIPLYAYSLFGMSEVEGGLLLMRLTLMIPVGAVLGGFVADRIGYRLTGAAGFVILAAGYLLVGLWPENPSQLRITADLMIAGFGFGLVIAPISATVIASAGHLWMATGSALVTVARMVGMTVGLASLSSWGIRRFNMLMGGRSLPLRTEGMTQAEYDALVQSYEEALRAALHTVYSEFFYVAAGLACIGVLIALFLHRRVGGPRRLPFLPH